MNNRSLEYVTSITPALNLLNPDPGLRSQTLSLTLASCRAFYVQRSPKLADPQPNVHMTLRVFPYMLIQVVSDAWEGFKIWSALRNLNSLS